MSKLLSVCIPAFNMEKYLSRNLDRFLDCEILEQLELIIVNDGSTDDTLLIANRYKNRYPDTITVINKPNGHYGSCVNAALRLAKAKFFRIVDADDWVDTCALKQMLLALKDLDADVVYTRYENVYEKDGSHLIVEDPAKMVWRKKINVSDVHFDKYVHMHQITYRTQFLNDIDYVQTEGVCYTDTEYVYMPLIQAKSIYCLDVTLYQYYVGRDDQSMAPSILMKNFCHLSKVLKSILLYPRPAHTNLNYAFLRNCYVNALFGMLVDCMYFSSCRNKVWGKALREIIVKLNCEGFDLSHYLSFSVKGFHWFKCWLEDSALSACKLFVFFTLINLRVKHFGNDLG